MLFDNMSREEVTSISKRIMIFTAFKLSHILLMLLFLCLVGFLETKLIGIVVLVLRTIHIEMYKYIIPSFSKFPQTRR